MTSSLNQMREFYYKYQKEILESKFNAKFAENLFEKEYPDTKKWFKDQNIIPELESLIDNI